MVANLRLKASKFVIQGLSKSFQVCDKYLSMWYCRKHASNRIFIHKWQEETTYKEDNVYLRDNIHLHHICLWQSFQSAGSFSKGFFYMKADTIKVNWGIMLSSYISFLGGHYPGAKNIPFADNLLDKHTNMLQTPEQLLRGWLVMRLWTVISNGWNVDLLWCPDHNKFKQTSLEIVVLCCTSRLFEVCCRLWWFIFGRMFRSYFSSRLLRTLRYSFVKRPPIARCALYSQCIQVDLRLQLAYLDLKANI